MQMLRNPFQYYDSWHLYGGWLQRVSHCILFSHANAHAVRDHTRDKCCPMLFFHCYMQLSNLAWPCKITSYHTIHRGCPLYVRMFTIWFLPNHYNLIIILIFLQSRFVTVEQIKQETAFHYSDRSRVGWIYVCNLCNQIILRKYNKAITRSALDKSDCTYYAYNTLYN